MIRNLAGQVVYAQMVDVTTGGAFVGTVTVYVNLDEQGQHLGTVGSGLAIAQGRGQFAYLPSAAETDGANNAYLFVGTGAISDTVTVPTITAAQSQALSAFTGPSALLTVSAVDLVTDAYLELNIYGANEVLSAEDLTFGLRKLNRILDNWNAQREAVYAASFNSYTLTPNLTPHTIGPSGTFAVSQRPVSIIAANLLLTSQTPTARVPIDLHDADWWSAVPVPGLASSIPTDLYYQPDWPNGSLFFYPVPSSAYGVELLTRTLLAAVVASTLISLPPGYRDALTLTLTEAIAPAYPNSTISPSTVLNAREARARIFANNVPVPKLRTMDSGMPGGGGGFYNYRTGRMG